MHRILVGALVIVALGSSACVPRAVEWDADVSRTPGALADSLRLVWVGADAPRLESAWRPSSWPVEPGACAASLRAARAPAGAREGAAAGVAYATWFTVRDDSSVVLRVARSDDGGNSWRDAVTADATDVGLTGCGRPAPFVSVDGRTGHVHLVYHLVAREGAGLFFTHSMDGGALFHAPVPIVYGDRPSAASVTSSGDTVVVAYEDPNSRLPRLGLALSRTQGHLFERRVEASDETGEANTPRVALQGNRVVVAWTASQRGGGVPRTALRYGTLLW